MEGLRWRGLAPTCTSQDAPGLDCSVRTCHPTFSSLRPSTFTPAISPGPAQQIAATPHILTTTKSCHETATIALGLIGSLATMQRSFCPGLAATRRCPQPVFGSNSSDKQQSHSKGTRPLHWRPRAALPDGSTSNCLRPDHHCQNQPVVRHCSRLVQLPIRLKLS